MISFEPTRPMRKTYTIEGKQVTGADGRTKWLRGLKCYVCYRVHWEPEHVREKYCPRYRFFHSNDWTTDPVVNLRLRTDPAFAIRFIKAVHLYRLHWYLVGIGLNACRLWRRVFPTKKVKQVNK